MQNCVERVSLTLPVPLEGRLGTANEGGVDPNRLQRYVFLCCECIENDWGQKKTPENCNGVWGQKKTQRSRLRVKLQIKFNELIV